MHKIICKNVPEALLTRETAKIHFRQFGSVKRITFRTSSRIITVEYGGEKSEEAVEKALQYGNVYDDKTFTISRESTSIKGKAKNEKIRSDKDVLNIPDDVQAELDAMGGGPSLALVVKSTSRREVLSNDTSKKSLKRRGIVEKDKVIPKKNKAVAVFKNDEYQELLEIINQRALTIEEKYKVLDARDKLLRILQKKNGAKSGSTKGTCPDMCPEKERLLRVIQHQVSSFEMNPFKEMDPNIAVKQYSRSSADQESPLPHELRPVNVLQNTMSYLLHKVLPLGDKPNVIIGDWFHFVWDRTRGIRKDITQQELCCPVSVELIELCARFHIHCSARLVAEDPSAFDQRINTENLTKCLQTLKYMYNDLRLKNVKCPNEAEFRGYIILLNLNDGNFMWELQRLPSEIQGSEEVKLAIDFHTALTSTNYVRFFKLVRKTTYLNACILMRYFMQIRSQAMIMILKSFTPRHTNVTYPLDTLVENLGFESIEHTIEYLQNCGLEVNQTENRVILDKTSFISPELNYTSLDRSISLVESKRGDLSLGIVVFGGPLPTFDYHNARSSFNDEGYLTDKRFVTEDLHEQLDLNNSDESKKSLPELMVEKVIGKSPSQEQNEEGEHLSQKTGALVKQELMSPIKSDEYNRFSFTRSIWSPTKETNKNKSIFDCRSPDRLVFRNLPCFFQNRDEKKEENYVDSPMKINTFKNRIDGIPYDDEKETPNRVPWGASSSNIVSWCPLNYTPIQHKSQCKMTEFRNMLSASHNFLSAVQEKKCSNLKKSNESDNSSFSRIISPPKKKSPEINNKPWSMFNKSKQELDEDQEQKALIKIIVSQMLDSIEMLDKLESIASKYKNRKTKAVIDKWRTYVHKKKQERNLNFWYTGAMFCTSLNEEALALCLHQHLDEQLIYHRNLNHSPLKKRQIRQNLDLEKYAEILKKRYDLEGVRIVDETSSRTPSIYWKCTISLPEVKSERTSYMEQTVNNYFNWEDPYVPLIVQKWVKKSSVRFCITKEVGSEDLTNDANGIIFIAQTVDADLNKRISEKFVERGIYDSIPVVVIVEDILESDRQLMALKKQGIISEYKVLSNSKKHGLVSLVEKGLKYLTMNAPVPPPIEVDFLENILFKKYLNLGTWQRVISSTQGNDAFRRCFCNPNTVFQLFNEGIQRLKLIILSEACYEYGRFPKEFKQFEELVSLPSDFKHLPELSKDKGYKNCISELLDTVLSIRLFPNWPPKNENELEQFLWKFSVSNFVNSVEFYEKFAYKLRKLINNDLSQLGNIMWTELFDLIFSEKFTFYKTVFITGMEPSWHFHSLLIAVYHIPSFESFLSMEWLNVANPTIKAVIAYEVDSKTSRVKEETKSEIDEAITKANRSLKNEVHCCFNHNLSEFDRQMDDLSKSITASNRIVSKFQQHFRQAMEEN